MYQFATAPRGIGQVLDSVFKLMKAIFVPLLPYAVIAAVIGSAPWIYMFQQGVFDNPAVMIEMLTSAGYWLVFLLTLPLSGIVYGAALIRTESIALGRGDGFGESFRRAGPFVVAIIVAMIAYMLAVTVGMVFLIVPGLLLAVSLIQFLPAIVLDGKGPVESLGYSHKLVWGNWWRTATVYTIAFILMYVLMLVIGVLFGLAFAFTGFDPAATMLVDAASSLVSGFLVMPFFCALAFEVYHDLKMRKTGGDLAARIEATSAAR
jgi:hypothetical protein